MVVGGAPPAAHPLPSLEHQHYGELGGLALSNGGALVFAGGLYDVIARVDALITLDANGVEQSRELYVTTSDGERWPAALATGETGLAMRLGDAYYLVRPDGRTRLGTRGASLEACNGTPSARLAVGENGPWTRLEGGHGSVEGMVIGFVHDVACIEAIGVGPSYRGDEGILAFADHGQLRAASIARDGSAVQMRCVVTPEEDDEEDEE